MKSEMLILRFYLLEQSFRHCPGFGEEEVTLIPKLTLLIVHLNYNSVNFNTEELKDNPREGDFPVGSPAIG